MGKRMRWLFAVVLVLLGLAGTTLALFQLYKVQKTYATSKEIYETAAETAVEIEQKSDLPSIYFSSLWEVNEEVVGWLYSPDTDLNYPVVQGADNSYYLTHLWDNSQGAYGTLFLDSESTVQDKNQVIYGHHMKDGSMFASLLNYKEQSYYNAHPVLYYITPNQTYEVWLFAGFHTNAVSNAYNHSFTKADFGEWLTEMQYQSDFTADFIPTEQEQVLTLSTCAYSSEDARYVVMGVLKPM